MNRNSEWGMGNAEWKEEARLKTDNPEHPMSDFSIPDFDLSPAFTSADARSAREFRIPHSKGFTLLEVMIAVSIMAGILAVIYMSFFTASRNIEQAEMTRDMADLARTLVARMSDEVTNAYVNTSMSVPTVFYGKKVEEGTGDLLKRHDQIDLTTLTNSPRQNSKETDLWEVGYFFKQKPDGSGWVLYRREKRLLSTDSPALEGGDEYELTDRVDQLRLRYNSGSVWSDDWDSRTRGGIKPKEFEITLVLTDNSTYTTHVEVGRQ